ncbi:MAG: hypothetical protein IPJ47_10670 [Anaerolineales bacterium]|nr:hypothetical protein [Anaerolineales bacterium]
MEAFANQGAQAIERAQLEEQNRQIALCNRQRNYRILYSIPFLDLRTPLVAITGALSALDEKDMEIDEPTPAHLSKCAAKQIDSIGWSAIYSI